MGRVQHQDEDARMLANHVLSWILFARRRYTTKELQTILTVEVGDTELDEENIPSADDIVLACAGLVTIDENSDIIRLVHYTAAEYFKITKK